MSDPGTFIGFDEHLSLRYIQNGLDDPLVENSHAWHLLPWGGRWRLDWEHLLLVLEVSPGDVHHRFIGVPRPYSEFSFERYGIEDYSSGVEFITQLKLTVAENGRLRGEDGILVTEGFKHKLPWHHGNIYTVTRRNKGGLRFIVESFGDGPEEYLFKASEVVPGSIFLIDFDGIVTRY